MEDNKKPSNPDLHKGAVNMIQDRTTLRDYFAAKSMASIVLQTINTIDFDV